MHLIISFLLNALALWLLTIVYKGVHADTTTALMIAALIFGVVNAIVRPILLVLSLPFIILTLGLFVFVVNGIVLWIVGAVVPGFHVYGLWAGIIGAIILGIISWIINAIALRSRLASDSAR